VALVALAACSTAPIQKDPAPSFVSGMPGAWSERWIVPAAYAEYLRARLAQDAGEMDRATVHLDLALAFDPESPYLHVTRAEIRLEEGDEEGARAALAEARRVGPDSPHVWLFEANLHGLHTQWKDAESAAMRAVELGPEYPEAYHALSEYQLRLGHLAPARGTLERLAELTPHDPAVFLALGDVCAELEVWECAQGAFAQMIRLAPSSEAGYLHLGTVLEDTGKRTEALGVYTRCGRSSRAPAECWYRRVRLREQWSALAQSRDGREAQRAAMLVEAREMGASVARDPDTARRLAWRLLALEDGELLEAYAASCTVKRASLSELQYQVGLLRERQGQLDTAVQAFGAVPRGSRFFVESRSKLAVIRSGQGRLSEAVEAVEAAIAAQPGTPELYLLLSTLHERAKHPRRSVATLQRGAKEIPDSAELHRRLARAAWSERDLKTAIPAAERVVALEPEGSEGLNFLGYLLAEAGQDLERAEELVTRAIALDGDRDGAHLDSLGWIALRSGRADEAVPLLEEAVALVPGDPTILTHLGDAYAADGQRPKAVETWKRAYAETAAGDVQRRILRRKIARRRP
jgi:tetratricopeptide (TPR) repeat protein